MTLRPLAIIVAVGAVTALLISLMERESGDGATTVAAGDLGADPTNDSAIDPSASLTTAPTTVAVT